ncbi:MAG: 16S rRNA (guanine(527)-N(7))-methyltransferase RsmG [Bacteroidales bacterium]|nr:16S rRNA (guanine(527)-N(7))-methyltransferase RsmG [Bacteroidales bacterium]
MDFEAFSEIVLRLFPDLTPSQMEQFRLMEGLYRDWNSKINVISRKDIDSFYSHHVLHSLAIALYLRREGLDFSGCSVLDLGTGGGFPGIPLAVMYPEARFTLCDSIGKKIKVASSVAQELGLANVECVNARAESLGRTFDHVVSRAVTTLENFYPWVKDSFRGSIFYLKGGDVDSETAALTRKFRIGKDAIRTWRVDSVLEQEYFAEKFVIQIEKNYLCPPKSE